ncbi:aldehyde ferredoxin oxidoreductase family protein [Chloroflexota bacterium]
MLKGYTGKIVRAHLTTGEISYEYLDEDTARKYIGGAGLAARILWNETAPDTEPLSPESPLVFMTGPLTGSIVPSSSRYTLAGLSPLTGIWGEAHSGGNWADELKHAGFDGIVVTGESRQPVYLWLQDGRAEIRNAGHLWGKDTYEVAELIKEETDQKASTACIGPAGEKLVRIACVMNDGRLGRTAARCGLGALMGAKKLKAIAVRGTLPISFYDEDELKESVNRIYALHPVRKEEVVLEEHVDLLKRFLSVGGGPVKNWLEGTFDAGYKLAEETRKAKPLHCRHCLWSDAESKLTRDGERHMVWEAWAPLGTSCLIDNAEALQQAYSLCNKYGVDTISTGGVISFAMECFEKGLITKDDTDGIELTWGNHEAMVEMVRKIGEREGFGELLGDGVRRAAERIGGIAAEYAMHVKGLELPAHDPRASMGRAVTYATGSIGAGHMEAHGAPGTENYLEGLKDLSVPVPDLGYSVKLNRFAFEGKGTLTAKMQDFSCMINSAVVCIFLVPKVPPSHFVELLNRATGWDMDLSEFMMTGERIFNLKRMFNVRRGISRKDDTLPPRILTHKRGSGGAADSLPFLGLMLNEYYLYRGWSEEGIPTKEKLSQLGLKECLTDRC